MLFSGKHNVRHEVRRLFAVALNAVVGKCRTSIEAMDLNCHRNKQLMRMNKLIQCVSYPFVKAFPGVSCGSG
ncbi:MAG: hypothetical protein U9N38_03620, partial [Thermodesulfobacteriota bacterium]|nr:hypothetical protein [Thermodesulfobacteriota bacterium]